MSLIEQPHNSRKDFPVPSESFPCFRHQNPIIYVVMVVVMVVVVVVAVSSLTRILG